MDVTARITSKGRLTLPRAVRDALAVEQGDDVVFRIADDRVELVRVPRLLELAGSVAERLDAVDAVDADRAGPARD